MRNILVSVRNYFLCGMGNSHRNVTFFSPHEENLPQRPGRFLQTETGL
jgi:hypothetical protein